MIFITGAAGKTGRAILAALAKQEVPVKALVRSHQDADTIAAFPNCEFIPGDLRVPEEFSSALEGIDSLYYICPNVTRDEVEIGLHLIQLVKKYKINHFCYHSVLHPQIEDMPHHWQKMRMEELLFKSGIDFTILQPCAYMQNILGGWDKIKEGKYIVPYRTSARLSIVDLQDIAAVAAIVLTQPGHENAIYELAGPQALSQQEVALALSKALEISVEAIELRREDWRISAENSGMDDGYALQTLLKMFEYYDHYGLIGNPRTLENLLGHKPTNFQYFLQNTIKSGDNW
jgi:NAD(P)H dehydrogenase (quinone)